jgi:hypothetical protein
LFAYSNEVSHSREGSFIKVDKGDGCTNFSPCIEGMYGILHVIL